MFRDRLREILVRNDLRREAGLPLLSVPAELRKMVRAEERTRQETKLRTSPLRKAIEAEVLAEERTARDDPAWEPSGILSGGRYAFALKVRKRLADRMR